jgi:ribonuclease P protein component
MASDTLEIQQIETFAKTDRLQKRREFLSVYELKRAYFFRYVVIYLKTNEFEKHRLGITVSKKVGCSVLRSRVKRLVREAFRRSRNKLPGNYDVVVNAKKDAGKMSLGCALETFAGLAEKVKQ